MISEVLEGSAILLPVDLARIASKARFKRLKKGELFIRAGERSYQTCIVIKGLLRHYMPEENGEEKTIRFVTEKMHSGVPDTLFNNEISTETVEALENTLMLCFDHRQMLELSSDNKRLLKLQNQIYRNIISENVKYVKLLNCNNAEKRYQLFCHDYPKLEQRIKQKHLASYLGITPVRLSQIRAIVKN